ncbi:MAG: hypothetical protein QM764_13060 [Chitinophagaceae bacterium]
MSFKHTRFQDHFPGSEKWLRTSTFCFLLILIAGRSFSQQQDSSFQFKTVDSATEIVDTTVVKDGTVDDLEEDSIKNAKYDYYISTDQWVSDSMEARRIPDTVIKSLKSQDDFWYADKQFEKDSPADSTQQRNFLDRLLRQEWFKTLIWIIIVGGFIAVLLWYLAESNTKIFQRGSKRIATDEETEPIENIFGINYEKEIANAVRSGNYRLGTRLLFLQLLKKLSEKNIIQYKQDKTNFDYLLQLSSTTYYKDFFRLARNYEYAWYGEFDVNADSFSIIKNEFEKFNNKLS